jgi:CheY-like chemotaxis protein
MYRIAVVDDNTTWCLSLETLLCQRGFAVSTFTSAKKFLEEAGQFDLALIDFSMPSRAFQPAMDGPDVIRQVKQQVKHPPLLVLISSFFTEDILKQSADLCIEADAYWTKGMEASELLDQVEQLLKQRKSGSRSSTKTDYWMRSLREKASTNY